ncbi:MAG TPA: hypothetical protein DEB24_02145 [Coriobacteriia bacterium]|nr:hypothetical protein [Coriobacteriia bacterium]
MRDVALLAKLKLRHLFSLFALILSGLLGSDVREARKAGERFYLAYSLALLAGVLFLLWLALLDLAVRVFTGVGAEITLVLLSLVLLVFPLVYIVTAIGHLRSCSIKMTAPDIAYIASSPIGTRSLVACSVGGQLLGYCLPILLFGYLIGVCLCSGLGLVGVAETMGVTGVAGGSSTFFLSLACTVVFALITYVMLLAGWSVGLLRLFDISPGSGTDGGRSVRRAFAKRPGTVSYGGDDGARGLHPIVLYAGAFLILILLLFALLLLLLYGGIMNPEAIAALLTREFPALCLALTGLLAVEIMVIFGLSARVSMMRVIERNASYADTHTLRLGLLYGLDGYNAVRRQRRVAARGALFTLPAVDGGGAVIARSLISHLRQFEGIPSLLFWGVFAAPCAAFLFIGAPLSPIDLTGLPGAASFDMSGLQLFLWIYWLVMLLLFPMGAREMTRSFHDDLRRKAVRNRLPFGTLELLVLNVLPSFILVNVLTLVVIVILWWSLVELPWLLLYGVAINVLLALCSGLDGLKVAPSQRGCSYELAILTCAFLLFLASLTGVLALIAIIVGMCIVALTYLIQYSSE